MSVEGSRRRRLPAVLMVAVGRHADADVDGMAGHSMPTSGTHLAVLLEEHYSPHDDTDQRQFEDKLLTDLDGRSKTCHWRLSCRLSVKIEDSPENLCTSL